MDLRVFLRLPPDVGGDAGGDAGEGATAGEATKGLLAGLGATGAGAGAEGAAPILYYGYIIWIRNNRLTVGHEVHL